MPRTMRIIADTVNMTATLDDSPAATALYESLPQEGMAQLLGASIFFQIEGEAIEAAAPKETVEEVEEGAVAYWGETTAVCIFFGAQPVEPVVPLGKVDGAPRVFRSIMPGTPVTLEKA